MRLGLGLRSRSGLSLGWKYTFTGVGGCVGGWVAGLLENKAYLNSSFS